MKCPHSILWWFYDPGQIVSSHDSLVTSLLKNGPSDTTLHGSFESSVWWEYSWANRHLLNAFRKENYSPLITWLWILSSQPLLVLALRTVHCKQSKWRNGPPGSQSYNGVGCKRAADEPESGDQPWGSTGSFDFPALIISTFLYLCLFWYQRASLPIPLSIFSFFSFCLFLYYSVCSEN